MDINPLRGLKVPSLYDEFDRWFTDNITVDRRVQHISLPPQHIHEYFCLISEKQQQYPNALAQCVTHTDTFFWLTC